MDPANSLHIRLEGIGKKFGSEWIFRNLNLELDPGDKIVLLGGNGSGKSTLMQVISGYVLPNSGKITFGTGDHVEENENYRNHFSVAAPYLELVEDYTLEELINHCMVFKPFVHSLNAQQIIEIAELKHTAGKYIRNFSSGMKQRVKLTLAILADCPLLLLDEPSSNLDKNAVEWYNKMVLLYAAHKTIVVCSNSLKEEFGFCTRELNIAGYKQI